jgi:hypothetical protein
MAKFDRFWAVRLPAHGHEPKQISIYQSLAWERESDGGPSSHFFVWPLRTVIPHVGDALH